MNQSRPFFAIALIALVFGQARAQAITVSPDSPKAFDTIRVSAEVPLGDSRTQSPPYRLVDASKTAITMAGNKVTVTLTLIGSDILAPSAAPLDIAVGQFPAGQYEVEVRLEEAAVPRTLGSASFTVLPRLPADPVWNHTDLWWDPNESGWGLSVVHHGLGRIFATWYVYDASQRPVWYVVSDGQWTSPFDYVGAVYRTSGPDILGCTMAACPTPFNPALVTREPVGSMRLTFPTMQASTAIVSFTIDGQTVIKNLRRQSF